MRCLYQLGYGSMSADEEIRTPTVPLLRRTSLPVGLRRHGARDETRTHTDFRPPASETGAFTSYATRADLCERGDSNSHGLSATSTSSWRVYQFRHARIGTAPGTRTLLILGAWYRIRESNPARSCLWDRRSHQRPNPAHEIRKSLSANDSLDRGIGGSLLCRPIDLR